MDSVPLWESLIDAAKEGDVVALRALCDKGADVNCVDMNGWYPVHYSAEKGDLECLIELVNRGANVNVRDNTGSTPLHRAAVGNRVKCVEVLLRSKNADITIRNQQDYRPYDVAMMLGHSEISAMLSNYGATTGSPSKNEKPPRKLFGKVMPGKKKGGADTFGMLMGAVRQGDHHMIVTLLNSGEDVNSRDADHDNCTPLHVAAEHGHVPCVALLLERGADAQAVNDIGWTALHALAAGTTSAHAECAAMLVQMGADIFARSANGETPRELAIRCRGLTDLVSLLDDAEVSAARDVLRQRMSAPVEQQGIVVRGNATATAREERLRMAIAAVLRRLSASAGLSPMPSGGSVGGNSGGGSALTLAPQGQGSGSGVGGVACVKCGASTSLSGSSSVASLDAPMRGMTALSLGPAGAQLSVVQTPNVFAVGVDNERLKALEEERDALNARCRKLMQSIAAAAQEHEDALAALEAKMAAAEEEKHAAIRRMGEERDATVKRCEATLANRLSKLAQETETAMDQIKRELEEADLEKADLLRIQSNKKLTWVPDDYAAECAEPTCHAKFTQNRRRHHCRCCGRVFCKPCVVQKAILTKLGYDKPVRVCVHCHALVKTHEDVLDTKK